MSDRSHANTSAAKQTDQDSRIELRVQGAAQVNDFKAGDKDSEDYTEDEEEIPETISENSKPAL